MAGDFRNGTTFEMDGGVISTCKTRKGSCICKNKIKKRNNRSSFRKNI